jgi:predicted transcriptional regulator
VKKLGRDIPAAELEVLGVLWKLRKATVREVLEALEAQGRKLAYTTVLTLLGRLERRGYVHCRRESPAHRYEPRISRRRVAAGRLGELIEQLGEGEALPLILQLVEVGKLKRHDIRQLKELLATLEEGEER